MMIRMVGGWVFLLVPAHQGSPGQRVVKRLLLLLCWKNSQTNGTVTWPTVSQHGRELKPLTPNHPLASFSLDRPTTPQRSGHSTPLTPTPAANAWNLPVPGNAGDVGDESEDSSLSLTSTLSFCTVTSYATGSGTAPLDKLAPCNERQLSELSPVTIKGNGTAIVLRTVKSGADLRFLIQTQTARRWR